MRFEFVTDQDLENSALHSDKQDDGIYVIPYQIAYKLYSSYLTPNSTFALNISARTAKLYVDELDRTCGKTTTTKYQDNTCSDIEDNNIESHEQMFNWKIVDAVLADVLEDLERDSLLRFKKSKAWIKLSATLDRSEFFLWQEETTKESTKQDDEEGDESNKETEFERVDIIRKTRSYSVNDDDDDNMFNLKENHGKTTPIPSESIKEEESKQLEEDNSSINESSSYRRATIGGFLPTRITVEEINLHPNDSRPKSTAVHKNSISPRDTPSTSSTSIFSSMSKEEFDIVIGGGSGSGRDPDTGDSNSTIFFSSSPSRSLSNKDFGLFQPPPTSPTLKSSLSSPPTGINYNWDKKKIPELDNDPNRKEIRIDRSQFSSSLSMPDVFAPSPSSSEDLEEEEEEESNRFSTFRESIGSLFTRYSLKPNVDEGGVEDGEVEFENEDIFSDHQNIKSHIRIDNPLNYPTPSTKQPNTQKPGHEDKI